MFRWGGSPVHARDAVWPLLILLSCGVAKLAATGKSFNTKTVYFLIALVLFSLLLAKLCFHSRFVSL
ncbi:MAG TPA: hypothetical protein DCF93_06355 [Desulfuromonas sp.]|nr:hypothetical protein [Desulfuromonas sp.]